MASSARGLRDECSDDNGDPVTLAEAVERVCDDVVSTRKQSKSNRFDAKYRSKTWGKFHEIQRNIHPWAHTSVLLTFSATPPTEYDVAPAEYLQVLESPASAQQTALSRALAGSKYRTVTVLGAHQSGLPHTHVGLWIDDSIPRGEVATTLDPVVSAHTNNCPLADPANHAEGAISVQAATGELHDLGLLGYLACNVPAVRLHDDEAPPGKDPDLLNEDEAHQRLAGLLFATGTDAIRL